MNGSMNESVVVKEYELNKQSQNKENVEQFCNVRNNPFHLACRKWYLYNNIIIFIFI